MFGYVRHRHMAKPSCSQVLLINWYWYVYVTYTYKYVYWLTAFCYVYVHKINSPVNTVRIPRRQPLSFPLKAHTCSHTQQLLNIHCDYTQEDSRHFPQNVCVYICSVPICPLLHTSFTHLTGCLVQYAFTLTLLQVGLLDQKQQLCVIFG